MFVSGTRLPPKERLLLASGKRLKPERRYENTSLTSSSGMLTAAARASMAAREAPSSAGAGGRKRVYCWAMIVALFFSWSKDALRIAMRPSARTAFRISGSGLR